MPIQTYYVADYDNRRNAGVVLFKAEITNPERSVCQGPFTLDAEMCRRAFMLTVGQW